jgi:hypothetical protein
MSATAKDTSTNALLDLQAQLRKELEVQKSTLPAATAGRISVKGKKFSIPGGRSSEGPLSAIILDWRWQRNYFEGSYNPNAIAPPVCSSSNKIEGELTPSPTGSKIQYDGACELCPKNQWGSDVNGKGKACKSSARLAIIPPDAETDTTPWMLDVAPTGLKGFVNYVNALQNVSGLLPLQIVTDIDFEPSVDYPQLTFSAKGPHEHLATAMNLRAAAQGILGQ